MKKRFVTLLLTAAMAASMLAGCSGSSSGTTTAASEATEASGKEAAADTKAEAADTEAAEGGAAAADGIVIAPLDSVSLDAPITEAYNSGTPVVLVDTVINSENYSASITWDTTA